MHAGQLDRLVTIQAVTRTRTPSGSWEDSWSDVDTVWARRRDTRGSERILSGAETATADAVFVIRWRPGLTAKNRIVDEAGEAWDIVAPPTELGRRDGLELTCRQVGA